MKQILAIMLALLIGFSGLVDAKGGSFGGRSSSGSSSFSRSSSSGSRSYSSPSRSSSSSSSSKSSNSGTYGFGSNKSSSSSKSIVVDRKSTLSGLGKKGATGVAAGMLYKDFQTKSAPPVSSKGKVNSADIDRVFSRDYRSSRRTSYYDGYNPSGSYIHTNSGYGMWDAMLMWSILDNVGDRQMYYHHQNDKDFQQWRTDANAACVAGDTSVCDKLKDLDADMAKYKTSGVVINPGYMTPGVDPDIYEANNIDPSKLGELKICTGSLGSDYSRFAGQIEKVTKLKVKSVPSNGSIDNLSKLSIGECDLAFTQKDANNSANLVSILETNQLEAAMLICVKTSNIEDSNIKTPNIKTLDDLTSDITVFVGSDQTGSQFTLNKLVELGTNFNKVKIDNSKPVFQIASNLGKVKNQCLFTVDTPDAPFMKILDDSKLVHMIPIRTEKDFPNGFGSYIPVLIGAEHYKNLTQDEYMKTFSRSGTGSIATNVNLVTPQTWVDQNTQLFNLLTMEKVNLQTSLQ